MPREIDVFGFFVPTLLPFFMAAFAAHWVLDGIAGRLGLYTAVWHPSLFRFSMFVLLFCGAGLYYL